MDTEQHKKSQKIDFIFTILLLTLPLTFFSLNNSWTTETQKHRGLIILELLNIYQRNQFDFKNFVLNTLSL